MIVGNCAVCGARLYHDSRFVRDELHAYCADHAPAREEAPPEEDVRVRAQIAVQDGEPIYTPKGIEPELAANEMPPLDVGAELTPEAFARKEARDRDLYGNLLGLYPGYTVLPPEGAKVVMSVPVRSDRWEAARALANLVLGTKVDEYTMGGVRFRIVGSEWPYLVAEAKRVLGEKP